MIILQKFLNPVTKYSSKMFSYLMAHKPNILNFHEKLLKELISNFIPLH